MFGDVVDGGEEFFVLALEGGVELEEVGAFDVPVGEVGLGHEGVTVGEEGFEGGGDGRCRFGGGCHRLGIGRNRGKSNGNPAIAILWH